MKHVSLAAAFVLMSLAGAGTALADQGIPVVPAQPLVSSAANGVAGEAYPSFRVAGVPVISEPANPGNGAQTYPTFATPRSPAKLAQSQIGLVQPGFATAFNAVPNSDRG
ncbi:hypothetical protein AruPA_14315 [Acidiphilium sp. PA]|uniref:hypothetical protein n=1 Tax=Acidiphilium sp. PA TaxID=2871705 RepID=UPI002244251F|nr:hypothetical protein [Acidiphilium sp. PA]MCW8308211.1 hypothetical protein [Acidiphilium sp. PA]